jgi:hypothetical protein
MPYSLQHNPLPSFTPLIWKDCPGRAWSKGIAPIPASDDLESKTGEQDFCFRVSDEKRRNQDLQHAGALSV